MLDLLIFGIVWLLFIFVAYCFLPSSIQKNRSFDILILFPILFLFVGRILELIFVVDLSAIGWSLFPVTEENQEIMFFADLPWLFFNFTKLIYNWNWFLLRILFALVFLKALFRMDTKAYEETKSTLFYSVLMAVSLIYLWLNAEGKLEGIDMAYANYIIIISVVFYSAFVYFRVIKKIFLPISWGVLAIIALNIYFMFDLGAVVSQDDPKYLVEVLTGIAILFVEHFRNLRRKIENTKAPTLNRLSLVRSNFSSQNKRNLLNEINSKFKKN